MSNIQLVYDPIKLVRTITKTKNGCTTTETQTEYLVPYDCKAGDKMILFLKDAAKAANVGGVIIGDIITRTYESGQYKYFVQYADSDLGDGVSPNTLTQCDILKVCCYDCNAEYSDRTRLSSVDAGCGIVVNDDGEFEANVSGVWGAGELLIANGDGPFTDGAPIYCGDDGELRTLPKHEILIDHAQVDVAEATSTLSITVTNPSTSRRMRITGNVFYHVSGTSAGTGSAPALTADLTVDGDVIFAANAVGTFTWDSGNPITASLKSSFGIGYVPALPIELEPEESKIIVIVHTLEAGVTIASVHHEVNILGFTI